MQRTPCAFSKWEGVSGHSWLRYKESGEGETLAFPPASQRFSNGGLPGNVQRSSGCHKAPGGAGGGGGRRVLLASSRDRPEMLLNPRQCTGRRPS